jgi:hypothetical protein
MYVLCNFSRFGRPFGIGKVGKAMREFTCAEIPPYDFAPGGVQYKSLILKDGRGERIRNSDRLVPNMEVWHAGKGGDGC